MMITKKDIRLLDGILREAENEESPLGKILKQTEMFDKLSNNSHNVGPLEEFFINIDETLSSNSELLHELSVVVQGMREASIKSSPAHQYQTFADCISDEAVSYGGETYNLKIY